jgi:FixJ family two-component response regulator
MGLPQVIAGIRGGGGMNDSSERVVADRFALNTMNRVNGTRRTTADMSTSDSPRDRGIGPVRHGLARVESRPPARGTDVTPDGIVYVVDDDPSVCRALARLLRTARWSVETFPSADAFLNQTIPARPACLVLDIQLPGLSGLDLQQALARAQRDVPIIFLTGHGDVPTSVRAMKAGAVDLLQKPVDDEVLLDCVRRALEKSQASLLERRKHALLQGHLDTLTPRERDVLLQVITGKLNKQIAGDLGIAEKTVKVHRGRVMQKMEAGSVADLVRMVQALRIGPAGDSAPPS